MPFDGAGWPKPQEGSGEPRPSRRGELVGLVLLVTAALLLLLLPVSMAALVDLVAYLHAR